MHARMRGEEACRVVDVHREHIADAGLAPAHRERLRAEASSTTHVAQHFDIGQEIHLDGAHTLTLTRLAATA